MCFHKTYAEHKCLSYHGTASSIKYTLGIDIVLSLNRAGAAATWLNTCFTKNGASLMYKPFISPHSYFFFQLLKINAI